MDMQNAKGNTDKGATETLNNELPQNMEEN